MNSLGAVYEDCAVKFLKRKGFKILKRNFSVKSGEIDIICMDGNTLVFVEVKGGENYLSSPAYRAGIGKLIKISKVGQIFISMNEGLKFEEVRIDVVAVDKGMNVEYFPSQRF
ncbi:MAG TPA: YraN family protein [Petrotogaceae bacterium]|jgi:putative endonuclease|nr:YraN family protein [Petrotogaceae bacterium]HNY37036.1 YraN family protein [Petrotogaceae bacterium]HOG34721.1 YraN family protein [Petrotogaceae bacterium]HPA93259.1 YraN family protein [Petrotogaceae bacterium]HPO28067.1 YraN family protein [Petrotogaceae bacterium]